MSETFVVLSKGIAFLAMAVYLLALLAKRYKPKPPPCDSCKKCAKEESGPFGLHSWRCQIYSYGWNDSKLKHCNQYEPRNKARTFSTQTTMRRCPGTSSVIRTQQKQKEDNYEQH